MRFLKDGRATWQRVWETEIGTTVQNDKETVTRHYIVDYLSIANRDIFVTEDGSYTTRYVYDAGGRRLSAEFDYAEGTHRGEAGENLQSDIAAEIGKVFYRTSILGSTLFAVDKDGNQIAHAIYDPWGKPLTETYTDANYSGLENLNNYTGYTWDITLKLYFAQNRFYDATTHRFTQEDAVKDGANWYVYCGNGPVTLIDPWGLFLPGTCLREGRQSEDVRKINQFLFLNGFMELYKYEYAPDLYSSYTTEAVKAFQKSVRLSPTGCVGIDTWRAMGFSVNSTIQEEYNLCSRIVGEFFEVLVCGNNITINYHPNIYFQGERHETVIWSAVFPWGAIRVPIKHVWYDDVSPEVQQKYLELFF